MTDSRTRRLFGELCLLGALAVGTSLGCQPDRRPSYKSPALADDQAAIIRSSAPGYFITEVDGARVDSGNFKTTFSGNSAKLTPGEHRIQIVALRSRQMGMQSQTYEVTWSFSHTFMANHAYDISANSFFGGLRMVDRNTNASTTIATTG